MSEHREWNFGDSPMAARAVVGGEQVCASLQLLVSRYKGTDYVFHDLF